MRITHLGDQVSLGLDLDPRLPINRNPHRVVMPASPCFTVVGHVRLRCSLQLLHVVDELLDSGTVRRFPTGHLLGQRQLPPQHLLQGLTLHAAPLFRDRVVCSSLDLEIYRRLRPILIKSNAQLVAVFVSVDCRVVKVQIR